MYIVQKPHLTITLKFSPGCKLSQIVRFVATYRRQVERQKRTNDDR